MQACDAETVARMRAVLARQRDAQRREGPPSAEQRIDRIARAIGLLAGHRDAIVDALREDFGHRSVHASLLTDVAGAISPLKFARKNLRRWMRPERRRANPWVLGLFGARARVIHQPKGVVGIVSPWNFPVQLTFGPLAGALAAGNRVLIKPSELTPRTSALMARLIRAVYDETEVAVFEGDAEVGAAFAGLPLDHLLFTGSTDVGRRVMQAAAGNLTPVTLELGGKSPAIVGRSADLELTAKRLMQGKTLNAGQVCLAPDYALVPAEKAHDFVAACIAAASAMFPTLKDNPDYTAIVNRAHYDRLMGYLADARAKGAEIVEINPAREDFSQQPFHKLPPALILDPADDMTVMRDEIFGPILPVRTYRTMEEAVDYVNARPRPLALYYFGRDRAEEDCVLSRTLSGGVTVNDTIMHFSMEDLPFGGVGASGMGAYHGVDGFRAFSHARAVFTQAKPDVTKVLRPPYGAEFLKLVEGKLKTRA